MMDKTVHLKNASKVARQFAHWCKHPYDRPLSERRELSYSLRFTTKEDAIQCAQYLIRLQQKIHFTPDRDSREDSWLVIASPVMLPTRDNVSGYGQLLSETAWLYGRLSTVAPNERDIFTPSDDHRLVSVDVTFPEVRSAFAASNCLLLLGKTICVRPDECDALQWDVMVDLQMPLGVPDSCKAMRRLYANMERFGGICRTVSSLADPAPVSCG